MKTETRQENIAPLADYFQELTAGRPVPMGERDTWRESIERIRTGTGTAEIDEDTYRWFSEILSPRWTRSDAFCVADGIEPFRLFWRRGGRYFVRRLTWVQTQQLCRLAGIRTYG